MNLTRKTSENEGAGAGGWWDTVSEELSLWSPACWWQEAEIWWWREAKPAFPKQDLQGWKYSGLPAHVLPALWWFRVENHFPFCPKIKSKQRSYKEGVSSNQIAKFFHPSGHPRSCTEIKEWKLAGFLDPSHISVQGWAAAALRWWCIVDLAKFWGV